MGTHELNANQKNKKRIITLNCCLLLFYATNYFLLGLCPAMTSLVVGLRRNSKALAKAKLAPKNVTVIVWWSATSLSHYSFLNPGENITSEKYAQQMRCTENCNACSQHWSTERAQFFSAIRTDCTLHNHCFKS